MSWIKLKKIFLNCLALLVLFSCGSGEVKKQIEDSYHTSGVEQFFLPELPTWANFSSFGQCYKSSSIQYLDFSKLAANYQLDYAQMIEMQAQYNKRREDYFSSASLKFLKPVEEAAFFSNTLEQVRGGIKHFKLPPSSLVEVLWLESFILKNKVDEIKKLAKSGRFDQAPPVLFSSCFSTLRLRKWVEENKLEEAGFQLLGSEWLSPFDTNNKLQAGLKLEFSKLINPGVKVNFIFPENVEMPLELNL
jgi:hypothetical protein